VKTDEGSTVSESIPRKEASVSAIRAAVARDSDGFRVLYVLIFLNQGGRLEGSEGISRNILGLCPLLCVQDSRHSATVERLKFRPGADPCGRMVKG